LLCDEEGNPVSTEVFTGNTTDPQTFLSQVEKVAQRFECQEVTYAACEVGRRIDKNPVLIRKLHGLRDQYGVLC